jgi:CRISPR/Cas system CSM-associated protein Csm2 small subunit
MKAVNNSVDTEITKKIYDLIDKKHKEDLRKVDYQYRSLKDSIEKWSKNEDQLGYEVDRLGIEGEENEETLERLMEELRAD